MKRDSIVYEHSFDLLRVIACMMVILVHCSARFIMFPSEEEMAPFLISNFYNSFSRVTIPLFVLMSGRFALSRYMKMDISEFYSKIWVKRIVFPTLFWGILYTLYRMLQGGVAVYLREPFNFLEPIKDFLMGYPFIHLWYMYMLIGLYGVIPILGILREKIGLDNFFYVAVALTILAIPIDNFSTLFWLVRFVCFLGYFMLGYCLKYTPKRLFSPKELMLWWLICSILTWLITSYCGLHGEGEVTDFLYGFFSPITIVGAVALYLLFNGIKNYKGSAMIASLSKHSLYIYLIHAGVLSIFENVIFRFCGLKPNPIWYVPTIALVVFFISYGLSLLFVRMKSQICK
ncbi:acyltransferase family protein [Halosquirtibacter laminarini]|uniref:Acyltransferase family protein n=1 Tax=Halosquirtibacter laminarini TaxID=3374600 RepID=A0AC61NCV9_9BACT|nr:acyltransferase family protein [Prolixibacteraceae bacterium]